MTRKLDDRPRSTPRWVRAAVLGGGLTGLVACGGNHPKSYPPTCGPCCHGSTGPECQVDRRQEPQPIDAGVDAPVPSD